MSRSIFEQDDWEQNRPWIAPRFGAWFASSRPQLSWEAADFINFMLGKHSIDDLGVTGSLAPSILIALAYGNEKRMLNCYSSRHLYWEIDSWNYIIEDSPGREESHPWGKFDIPFKKQVRVWDGGTPFFQNEAIFCDMSFSHPCVRLKLESLIEQDYKLIMLGFLEEYNGPDDVYDYYSTKKEYSIRKEEFETRFIELDKKLKYTVVIFERIS